MYCRSLILCLALLCLQQAATAHPGAHETIQYFTQQIEAAPKQAKPYIQRGIAYSNDGQFDLALADFQQAAKLGDPGAVDFDLGVLYYRMGEFEPSREHFDNVLDTRPDHPTALEYRARLARDAGDYKTAIADFRRLFEVNPQANPGHYVSTAQMLSTMGPEGIEQALAILDQGNSQLGITPQLQQYAIALELQRDRPDQAIARHDTLQAMLGASPEWKVDKAVLLLQTGDDKQARQLLEAAAGQLQSLRKTPARLETQQRIEALLATG